jgi:SAM-dependent methyltransferase
METFNLAEYWNSRYVNGGSSGAGSYGQEALMKATIINHWVQQFGIRTISEFGCGDGANLLMYKIPIAYSGYDISPKAIEICKEKTRKIPNSLKYEFTSDLKNLELSSHLMLCLDVWFHQTSDKDFLDMCDLLFNKFCGKYIIIYSTDTNSQFTTDGLPLAPHMHPREVLSKIQEFPNWEVIYWISGIQVNYWISGIQVNENGKVTDVQFPSEKRFYLLRRKALEVPKE